LESPATAHAKIDLAEWGDEVVGRRSGDYLEPEFEQLVEHTAYVNVQW